MSPPEKSRNTIKSTSSRESEGSPSPSKCVTLGEVAASLRLDFLAKTSQSLVVEKDSKATEVDSGGKPLQPLAGYDQKSSSWRMFQPSLLEESEPFSGRWPRSGIVLNGIAYQLDTLAHRTKGTASGLLESGMWPTPKSQVSGPDYARVNRPRSGGDDLATSVARTMWPTPRASEWKGTGPLSSKSHKYRLKRKYLDATVQEENQKTGQLSADWVSILMGYSLDWTIVEDGNAESPVLRKAKRTEPRD